MIKKMGMKHAERGKGMLHPVQIKKGGITAVGKVGKTSFGFGGKVRTYGR